MAPIYDMSSISDIITPQGRTEVVEVNYLQVIDPLNLTAEEVYYSLHSMVEHRGGRLDLTLDDFKAFCQSVIYYRVLYVRNEDRGFYNRVIKTLFHPHFLGSLVATLGKVYIDEYAIELAPAGQEGPENLLKEEDLLRISRSLRSLKTDLGISVGDEFTRDKSGDVRVMAMGFIKDESDKHTDIVSQDKLGSPTQAAFSMLLGLEFATGILSPRITYIRNDQVNLVARSIAQFESPSKV